MAFCTNCGCRLAEGAKFCFECGAKIGNPADTRAEARKPVYDGEIYRCPNCGDILDAYESVCQTCGYERRGARATSSVQELAQKLEAIESQRPLKKKSIFSQVFTQGSLSKTDEQKINLIQSFPIPNTKEDIMEFAVMAISNVDPDAFRTANNPTPYDMASKQAISNAWLSKFEQAYQKGNLMFGGSSELENVYSLYIAKKKSIKRNKNGIWMVLFFGFGCMILLLVLLELSIFFVP